jgi:hypothetical protein
LTLENEIEGKIREIKSGMERTDTTSHLKDKIVDDEQQYEQKKQEQLAALEEQEERVQHNPDASNALIIAALMGNSIAKFNKARKKSLSKQISAPPSVAFDVDSSNDIPVVDEQHHHHHHHHHHHNNNLHFDNKLIRHFQKSKSHNENSANRNSNNQLELNTISGEDVNIEGGSAKNRLNSSSSAASAAVAAQSKLLNNNNANNNSSSSSIKKANLKLTKRNYFKTSATNNKNNNMRLTDTTSKASKKCKCFLDYALNQLYFL